MVHAINGISHQLEWGIRVESVEINAFPWSGHAGAVEWVMPGGLDTLWIHGLNVSRLAHMERSWDLGDVHVESLRMLIHTDSTAQHGHDESNPALQGLPKITASLPNVNLNALSWDTLEVWHKEAGSLLLWAGELRSGRIAPDTVSVDFLAWDSGHYASANPSLDIALERSELQMLVQGQEWHVNSPGLNLPGFHVEGSLSWPLQLASGRLDIGWNDALPWLGAFGGAAMSDLEVLRADTTTATWDQTHGNWTAHVQGPSWLEATASGDDDHGSFHASVTWPTHLLGGSQLPVWMRETRMWNVHAHGEITRDSMPSTEGATGPNVASKPWTDVLSGRVEWTMDDNLFMSTDIHHVDVSQLQGGLLHGEAWVQLHHWPGWLDSPEDELSLTVSGQPDSLNWQLSQRSRWGQAHGHGTWMDSAFTCDVHATEARWTAHGQPWQGTFKGSGVWGEETLRWDVLARSPLWDHEALSVRGSLPHGEGLWRLNVEGAGVHVAASSSASWVDLASHGHDLMHRTHDRPLPSVHASMQLDRVPWLTHLLAPALSLDDTLYASISSSPHHFKGFVEIREWTLGDFSLGMTQCVVDGSPQELFANAFAESGEGGPSWFPLYTAVDIRADTAWAFDVGWTLPDMPAASWSLEATPPLTSGEINHPWGMVIHRGEVPLPHGSLTMMNTPVQWTLQDQWLPPQWSMEGLGGEINFVLSDHASAKALNVEGAFPQIEELFPPDWFPLTLENTEIRGHFPLDRLEDGHVQLRCTDAVWNNLQSPSTTLILAMREGKLTSNFQSRVKTNNTQEQGVISGEATWNLGRNELESFEATGLTLPLGWIQSFVDSADARIQGTFEIEKLHMWGKMDELNIVGTGHVLDVRCEVPSLGTHFSANGALQIESRDITFSDWRLRDARGSEVRVSGAAYQDDDGWNLNLGSTDGTQDLLIMDLPYNPEYAVYGTLLARGDLDFNMFDHQVLLVADVTIDAPTEFNLSLVSGSTSNWGDVVRFVTPETPLAASLPDDNPWGLRMEMNLDVKKGAKAKLITDELTGASIVGRTTGNLEYVLEDWDRMELRGELEVVEGTYDFALGQWIKKKFTAQPGGRLRWDGDPYKGSLDLDAVFQTRANVAPMIGTANGGRQMEAVDVILHLNGPMLRPQISFDLDLPKTDAISRDAFASALMDESEQTSQAIALLSLQEFIPEQVNTLQLGASGLQDNSLDVLTSQLSGWLSRINDDLEIGVSYDPNQGDVANAAMNQDALQLAMKATLLNDKLEIEGSFGSRDLSQESLTATHLQDLRILYHLNEEQSLQLTGFSESQSSITQGANSTTQGVGIRWHRSFSWPWKGTGTLKTDEHND